MKIVLAPDSFKESLTAMEVASALEAGFREICPDAQIIKVPVADGGEGTVDAMISATGGRVVHRTVSGPLGKPVGAFYGLMGGDGTAVIETAAACGLKLIEPACRNPMISSSFGVGELIRDALDSGARHLIVGIGGSATNDAGSGMLQALGVRLLDGEGRPIGPGGGALEQLERIDVSGLDPRIRSCRIEVACDVDIPLTGPYGASAVFGPQKGATPDMVRRLDANLARFADRIWGDLGVGITDLPGGGAAGGMGAALFGVLGATMRSGVEIVTDAVGLLDIVADADLVVTGEGRIDGQTIHGKTPIGVARVAKRHGKPVIGIAGSLGSDVAIVYSHGLDAVFSVLHRPCTIEEALSEAAANLSLTARNVAAILLAGRSNTGPLRPINDCPP